MASSSDRDEGYENDRVATEVDQNFHCAVCWKILKDPLMCPRNQHLFCTGCITEHLSYSQTCPTCKDELTLETLTPAPRVVTTYLSEIDIRCDYHARGCPEFVQVGMLKTHVASCGFSPVVCRNEGCTVEINKRDRIHHETEVCELRKVQCHECTGIRKEINEMKASLNGLRDEFNVQMRYMSRMQDEIVKRVEEAVQQSRPDYLTGIEKEIFVVGGLDSDEVQLASVEMFSPSQKKWVTLPPMKTGRDRASCFVYKDQLFVAGGDTHQWYGDTIATMTINQDPREWREFPARLPARLTGHKCVVHNDRIFVIGGFNANESKYSDAIYEVLLEPPYSTILLRRMPQRRAYHGVQLYDDRILIVGGRATHSADSSTDSIAEYDINKNEYRELAKLPFAFYGMATVRWGSHVIVMGGRNKEGEELNTVIIFDIEKKVCHTLPSMKHRRAQCAAVVSGNSVVVMGGFDEDYETLDAVECFRFDRSTWERLPPMTVARRGHIAVVKPG